VPRGRGNAQRIGPGAGARRAARGAVARGERFARQRDLLTTIVNALPDPVLLTTRTTHHPGEPARGAAVHRAADDSEGRRRAVQINNLLFSSFLTQSTIGAGPRAARAEPGGHREGSDLLFEVLSVPMPRGRRRRA
jgi:hypothetical protein